MGLSKSKPRKRKGEEHNKSPAHSVSKPKEKVMEKEAKPPDRDVPSQPADSLLMGAETAKYSQPSASSEEKPDTKQKSSKKKTVIPQIIITRASNEMLVSYGLPESEEQRTIREHADWGPYYRHRSPSTIAAYGLPSKE
uniref:Spermatogenesis-associated protein 33 n=2 Tax=Nannospalax galili TaxID=1026970 RepID=A0A8C6R3D7_NANGA